MAVFLPQTLARWWSTRLLVQTIIGQTNNMVMMLPAYVGGDDEYGQHARYTIMRYLNLAQARFLFVVLPSGVAYGVG